ncbi:MAG: glycosyltransferase, partial [Anaerolineales bacterium]
MLIQRYLKGHSEYQQARQAHWDKVATSLDTWRGLGGYYQKRLTALLKHIIPENRMVLEIGCGDGKLLQSLNPKVGVGIDFSSLMCERAKSLYPDLNIIQADAHNLPLEKCFDFIVISDLLNDLWDAQQFIKQIKKLCDQDTRIIINVYSRLWEIPLTIGQKIKLAKPNLLQNWFSPLDIEQLLELEDIEVINYSPEIIFPFYIPFITPILNRLVGRFWPFKLFALTNLIVARHEGISAAPAPEPTVSVVIPARNESGNIESLFQRTPEMGSGTELIFIEGHSLDNTYETIKKYLKEYPDRNAKLLQQSGKGKGDAVRLGFEEAAGDILMILDADLSVPPEDLSLFYDALVKNKGEFINGVRLVYPMEDQA